MNISFRLKPLAACFAVLAMLFSSVAGIAQETTGAIRGQIVAPDGSPAANTNVRITDTRTGSGRTTTTDDRGVFAAAGLKVGGPYSLAISSDAYGEKTVNDVFLSLGDTYTISVGLDDSTVEEVIVSASVLQTAVNAVGPSSAFSLSDLQSAPAINRDIKDVIRIDPRIYIDEAFNDAITCGGANPRFNSLTVDGVRLNDNFGLNSNGYPTERIPFGFDVIEQLAVELAPFDVQYGGFTACNINAVTKSGENEFHGSAFIDYTDDSLTGDTLEGDKINQAAFDEKRYGLTFGGPIIKDRLFFFAAYEKLDGVETFDRGPVGSGAAREVDGLSQADFDEINRIANDLYGYDPGGVPSAIAVEDEKLLVKLDLNINDNHRAALTYNYNDGFSISQADGDADEFEFQNHLYERGAELTSYSAQLFSDWSDNFSTELRLSYSDLDNRQLPLAGTEFGEVQINTRNDPDGDGVFSRATVFLGADDSRHANKLAYDSTGVKLAGTYLLGEHTISGGYERDELNAFNLFIQEAEGEYRFSDIQAFLEGRPNRITYENAAPSNNKNDAAASFGYTIHTFYLQDEYTFAESGITVVGGLRYDGYSSDDLPTANANFLARNGYSNSQNFDGEGLVQPRFGFTWDPSDNLNIRGGIGLYSGGNPNVWLSNNYSNDGITQVEVQDRSLDDDPNGPTLFDPGFYGGAGRPIYDIPQNLLDQVANGTANSTVNSLSNDFDIPSEWKYAIGLSYDFDLPGGLGDGYTVTADVLVSQQQDAAVIVDSTMVQVGTAVDGRPIYRGVDLSDPDCVDASSPNCSRRGNQDFILSNAIGDEGFQASYTVGLSKSHDWGLDWSVGYSYTESSDVNPMTSSVAFSNFANIATSDPNNPGRAQSNYEIPNRFTMKVNYEKAFFGDNRTKFTLFGTANEGRPYSYVFDSGFIFGDSVGFISRQLLYVPTGPNDPNVVFDAGFNTAAFFAFVNESGLSEFGGKIAPRNSFHSSWWTKFDLKVEQEFPGFADSHKVSTYLLIENLGNLLNDDWGVLKEASFPRAQNVVDAGLNGNGQYVFNEFIAPDGETRETDASLWEMRFGFKYNF